VGVAVLRPPLLVVGYVASRLYRLLFSRYDERLARKHEEALAGDVRRSVPFLFTEMSGRIVSSDDIEFPPPFDYAVITVETSSLRVRFTRGREHLAVQLAPKLSPNSWHELSTMLGVLEIPGVQRGSISDLAQVDRLLRVHVREITHAFADDKYPALRAQLQEIYARDHIVAKQLETEINRKLYG
jgi:hypothetical protein